MKKLTLSLLLSSTLFIAGCIENGTGSSASEGGVTETGESTARMTISVDYLYAIACANVQLLDISVPAAPAPWTQV